MGNTPRLEVRGEVPPGPTSPCDRCGSCAGTPALEAIDPFSGERFLILACAVCGLCRTDCGERDGTRSSHYGPVYYGARGERFLASVERVEGVFRRVRACGVARLLHRRGRVLDLGCGRGLMLAALREMGWECVGTETSAELAKQVRRTHGLEIHSADLDPLPFPDDGFDVVTAWHSLEHMERPVHTLQEIRRVLKPEGFLVIEVPNGESLQALLARARWFHLDVPRHRYHFSRRQLRSILSEGGFEILRESTRSLEHGPFGMVQSLLNLATFSTNVLFRWLRRRDARPPLRDRAGSLRALWDIAATAVFSLPLALAGTALEAAAILMGRGGVVRIVARKGRG